MYEISRNKESQSKSSPSLFLRPCSLSVDCSAGDVYSAYWPLHSLTSDSKRRSLVTKTSPSATAEKRPSAQSLPSLSQHCCITRLVTGLLKNTWRFGPVEDTCKEHSKTTQEDVPEWSQSTAQQDPTRTNPVLPDPTTFQNFPRTIAEKHSVNERLTHEEASKEASEDKKAHVESRRQTGSRGDSCPSDCREAADKPCPRQVPSQ